MSAEVGSVKYRVELDDSTLDQETKKTENKIAAGFKGAAGAVGAAALGAAAAGTAAVAGLVSSATEAYGEYEQLAGGVETLFKDSADAVMVNAQRAYKTAGMSANDYMETVTSFSASLIQSTGRGAQTDLAELKNNLEQQLKETKRAQQDEYKAAQKAWSDKLALAKKSGATNLDELKKQKDEELLALKRSNEDALDAMKVANKQKLAEAEQANLASTSTTESIARAADLADQAIIDMSDNANKMGTQIESIQVAYAGFAKGNFTMLDNLKLGYGGTKNEMERLLFDAQQISGIQYDVSSYADIVEAIHVIQTEMGITGTTAKEAGETLQGSFGAMQAAWQNLVIGMADPEADIGDLVEDMVTTAETYLENLIPIVERALQGLADAVVALAPILAEEIPKLTEQLLPELLKTGTSAIEIFAKGMLDALPTILPTLTDLIVDLAGMLLSLAPEILQVGLQLIGELAMGIAQALPELVPVAIETILSLVEFLVDPDNIGMLVDAAIALTMGLAEGLINALPVLLEKAPLIVEKLITSLIENSAKLNVAAVELVIKLATGIWEQAPKIVEAAWKIIGALIEGIGKQFVKIYDTGGKIVEKIKDGIKKLNPAQWGKDVIDSFVKGILGAIDKVKETAKKVAQTVKDFLGFSEPKEGPLSDFHVFPIDMVDLYAKGIEDNTYKVEDAVKDMAGSVALGFDADVNYSVPDIAGYARDLSASITGTGRTVIEVPVVLDGREIARASAWYMGEQLAWEAR